MGWKHNKKQSKWLTRGGRKVRCYLCGKRILNRDLFLFHAERGYYSHQSCFTESKTMAVNERRKAVKKIAVGAALVTAIAAGAGKFIDISPQSKGSLNSPDTQTILTSQGLILPALTSDPANPVPGQMWYRSDAGVTAHFDAIQNRVVYSSEINDGNVNVTSKGIINGLSVLPNDGKGGFGPDTTKGATAPGQYGSPYTETSGIQEGVKYGSTNSKKVVLLGGIYNITTSFTERTDSTGYYLIELPVGTLSQPTIVDIEGAVSVPSVGDNTTFDSTLGGVWINTKNVTPVSTTAVQYVFSFPQAGSSSSTANFCQLTMKNIQIYSANSYYGGIYGEGCLSCDVENCFTLGTVTQGGNPNVDSFVLDAYYSGAGWANNISSAYMYSTLGIAHSHLAVGTVSGTNNTTVIIFRGGYAHVVTILHLTCGGCIYSIYNDLAGGNGVQISITSYGNEIHSGFLYDVYDPNTNISGQIMNSTIYSTISSNWVAPTYYGGFYLHLTASGLLGGRTQSITVSPVLSNPVVDPPVSGTVYRNANPYDIRLKIPVTYSPTSTAAATLATGISTSSTVTTSTKVSIPAGLTAADGEILTYEMVVPAGMWYELVATNATIGTVEVQAA